MINFLNSANRIYNGSDVNQIVEGILETGILDTNGTDFLVEKTTGLDVRAKKGSLVLTVESGGDDTDVIGTQKVDTVLTCADGVTNYIIYRAYQSIIDADTIDASGSNSDACEVVTTLPATDPFTLLATVIVPGGATSLTDDMITDNRVYAILKDKLTADIFANLNALINESALDSYSDGVGEKAITSDEVLQNNGDSQGQNLINVFDAGGTVQSGVLQVFTAPVADFNSIKFKKLYNSIPDGGLPMTVGLYTLDGLEDVVTLIEEVDFTESEWENAPQFDYFEVPLSGSYTLGVDYGILIYPNYPTPTSKENVVGQTDIIDVNTGNYYTHNTNFKSLVTGIALDFSVSKKESVHIGKTNLTTQNAKLGEVFTASTVFMDGFKLKKSANTGTPTEDVEFNIYAVDVSDDPTGDAIATTIMKRAEYDAFNDDEEFMVHLQASTVIGVRYIVEIKPLGNSDANYINLYYGSVVNDYTRGKLRGHNTVDGWFDINYDIYFKLIEGSQNKFVETNSDGFIAPELIDLGNRTIPYQTMSVSIANAFAIKVSPSGKYFMTQSNGTAPTFKVYEFVDGLVTQVATFSCTSTGASVGWSAFWGRNDRELLIGMNDVTNDIVKLWVDDPLVSLGHAHNDVDYDYTEANTTSTNGAILYDNFADKILLFYASDDVRVINYDTFVLESSVTNIGVTIQEAQNMQGFDKDGLMYYTNISNTLYTYQNDEDNTFTEYNVQFPVFNNYDMYFMALKTKRGRWAMFRTILTHLTTSTSSASQEQWSVETIIFDNY